MKIVIAGTRTFSDYKLMDEEIKKFLIENEVSNPEIVSGMSRGADKLGFRWAEQNGFQTKKFPADWNKYGRAAGPIRNKEMLNYGDSVLVFWDGKSVGTKHMIDITYKSKKKIKVINYAKD